MARKGYSIDGTLGVILASLVVIGAITFASAAFGLLARGEEGLSSVFFNHLVLGVCAGIALGCIVATTTYAPWRKAAPLLFIFALLLCVAVFVPGLGMSHGGGTRWLRIAQFTLQPSELLKLATLLIASAYCVAMRDKIATLKYGMGGFLAIIFLPLVILVLQPDIGTLGVITLSTLAVFFVAGLRMRDLAVLIVLGIGLISILALYKPYVWDRIETFIDPGAKSQVQSYQLRQSLIAVGAGGLWGRGVGQGVQKFTYLPEPMGDSIFAVVAEELGFVGASIIVLLYLGLALRGFRIANRVSDLFGRYLAVGLSCYLVLEAFINIASVLGLAPLTGIPLTFMSQGGSAILVSLISAGLLVSIARHRGKGA